jgi:hypothetical protein
VPATSPAAIAAGVTGDLARIGSGVRSCRCCCGKGRSLAYVAEQAGHSLATLARYCAGVIEELEDQPRVPAGEAG